MFKKILITSVLLLSTTSFAATLVCKSTLDQKNERTILIADSAMLVCESPKGSDLNPEAAKKKYCAASMFLTQGFGKSSSGPNLTYRIQGQTMNSVFNDLTEGLVVVAQVTGNTQSGFSGNITFSLPTGQIVGPSVVISKSLSISLPKVTTVSGCVVR
jgi:hypothetical protein